MFVTYKPESGDEQRWEFDPAKVRQSAAEMIEKRYGGGRTYEQWKAAVQQGESRARRVLLWHLMTRDHHTLRYEDVPDFLMGEFEVEFSLAELHALREQVLKVDAPDKQEERENTLVALDIQITEAMAREGVVVGDDEDGEPEPVGKARSKKSGSGTGSPSPS